MKFVRQCCMATELFNSCGFIEVKKWLPCGGKWKILSTSKIEFVERKTVRLTIQRKVFTFSVISRENLMLPTTKNFLSPPIGTSNEAQSMSRMSITNTCSFNVVPTWLSSGEKSNFVNWPNFASWGSILLNLPILFVENVWRKGPILPWHVPLLRSQSTVCCYP